MHDNKSGHCQGVFLLKIRVKMRRNQIAQSKLTGWSARHMRALSNEMRNTIVVRTFTRGEGVDDKPLPTHRQLGLKGKRHPAGAYSLGWGLVREGKRKAPGRKGRSRKSRHVNKVDLTFTGSMLRQFKVRRVTRYTALIGATGGSKKYASFTNKLRPWMGLSRKDRGTVAKAFRAIITRVK